MVLPSCAEPVEKDSPELYNDDEEEVWYKDGVSDEKHDELHEVPDVEQDDGPDKRDEGLERWDEDVPE